MKSAVSSARPRATDGRYQLATASAVLERTSTTHDRVMVERDGIG